MPLNNRIKPIIMTSVDATTLNLVNWSTLKASIEKPLSILRIVNASNTAITISYDPDALKTPHDYLMPDSILELNLQANHIMPSNVSNLAQGTSVYIRGNPGFGEIYCSGMTSFE